MKAARKSERKTGIEMVKGKRAWCGQGKGDGAVRDREGQGTKEMKGDVGRMGQGEGERARPWMREHRK